MPCESAPPISAPSASRPGGIMAGHAGARRVIQGWHGPADRRRFRELGAWGEQTLAEIVDRHAALSPGKLAVRDGRAAWTYGEFGVLPLAHLAANRIGALFVP